MCDYDLRKRLHVSNYHLGGIRIKSIQITNSRQYLRAHSDIILANFTCTGKGGAYSVTLHLYRRAIAGAIARGLSLHKRSRLHFLRGSKEEAARVAEEAKSHFETGRCSEGNGFSARHSRREYGYYEQFRGFRSGPEYHYE